jgi:hypothetical protein
MEQNAGRRKLRCLGYIENNLIGGCQKMEEVIIRQDCMGYRYGGTGKTLWTVC